MNQTPYTVLLVDDEPIILRSLEAAVPWEELGVRIVGKARNGEEALQLYHERKPDMIISDIRMPSIDGIALMSEVRSCDARLIFIVISGYGDFEYARRAIREGASDYLLKPIDHDELTAIIRKSVAKLDAERRAREESDQLMHSVQALSLLARERLLAELTEGSSRPLQHLKWLEMSLLEQPYQMAIVQLDRFSSVNKQWTPDEKRLWLFAVRNILEEWSGQNEALAMFPFHSGEWILLFPADADARKGRLGEEIVRHLDTYAKLSCSVGFSRPVRGLDQLNAAYRSAQRALYQRFFAGQQAVFADLPGDEETSGDADHLAYPRWIEDELMQAIRALDLFRLLGLLDQLHDELESSGMTREALLRFMTEIAVISHREFAQLQLGSELPLDETLQQMEEADTLEAAILALKDAYRDWTEQQLKSREQEDGTALIGKAQRYIDNHYRNDLGIDEVSDFVGLSTSHFCALFKQVSGLTFLEYLTRCRIDKARYILANTEVKVYQLAPLVGYQDPRYFTQVFKKVTGMTPSEYRSQGVEDQSS
ncbi:DNA-binding response regulator [Paenibacillus sp. 598K]|uniref:response regulator n=1 Tax=Paenibacillus sp. 598K TaxID=1117987 RepID=UPI000FFA18BA|nr:response regulator [Paenibacillus sp. 598K]GBF75841.1 DNA-binding response regulator [Paenibacillus sp. 598K]